MEVKACVTPDNRFIQLTDYTEAQKNKLRSSNVGKTQLHSRTVSALCIQSNMELNFSNLSEAARYFKVTRHRIKNNLVDGWSFVINDPIVSIKDLKKTYHGSESMCNT
jgi:hypothetical protein